MQTELDTVIVEFDESTGIGTLVLNRPESLNALNGQLSNDIATGLQRLEDENSGSEGVSLRAVVIEGAGDRAFCAGADITGFSSESSGRSSARSGSAFIKDFPVPIIAKIQGYCLGGGLEMAFACDFRIASEDSTFGLPEVTLGLNPGGGGVQYITKIAGASLAKEIAMTGKHISAERAHNERLIQEVHPKKQLDDAVQSFAEELANQAPLAVQAIKESAKVAQQTGLEEGRKFDSEVFSRLQATEDAREGRQAFAEDRDPEFQGK